ncbi:MAG TPA: TIGR00159 family protein [Aquificales bacterium]|nr:TIGR00159 family protein [Aquificales bacterium]
MCEGFAWFKYLFSYKDLLDIAILSGIFYLFFEFLIRYRGLKLLSWVIAFIGLWFVALLLNLRAVGWLIGQFWEILPFTLVVIFQPELRRALQTFGGRGLFFQKYSRAKTIKKVIKAIAYMAEKQIGALIVFERSVPVVTLSEGCVKLDALVSPELLITIFYPLTPLHDGAAIIRGNRITYAACVLPLAQGVELDTKLGTRHRAAIGITQNSDALAVVVSEETGSISLAVGGKLYRNLTEEELKEILFKELGIDDQKE